MQRTWFSGSIDYPKIIIKLRTGRFRWLEINGAMIRGHVSFRMTQDESLCMRKMCESFCLWSLITLVREFNKNSWTSVILKFQRNISRHENTWSISNIYSLPCDSISFNVCYVCIFSCITKDVIKFERLDFNLLD